MAGFGIGILFYMSEITGAVSPEDQDNQITEHRDDKRVLYPENIGEVTLEDRYDRAAQNGHYHQRRALAGIFTQSGNGQRIDIGKHNGIKDPDAQNTVHGHFAMVQHSGDQQDYVNAGEDG